MPDQNKKIISKYQGDKNPDKRYLKLGSPVCPNGPPAFWQ